MIKTRANAGSAKNRKTSKSSTAAKRYDEWVKKNRGKTLKPRTKSTAKNTTKKTTKTSSKSSKSSSAAKKYDNRTEQNRGKTLKPRNNNNSRIIRQWGEDKNADKNKDGKKLNFQSNSVVLNPWTGAKSDKTKNKVSNNTDTTNWSHRNVFTGEYETPSERERRSRPSAPIRKSYGTINGTGESLSPQEYESWQSPATKNFIKWVEENNTPANRSNVVRSRLNDEYNRIKEIHPEYTDSQIYGYLNKFGKENGYGSEFEKLTSNAVEKAVAAEEEENRRSNLSPEALWFEDSTRGYKNAAQAREIWDTVVNFNGGDITKAMDWITENSQYVDNGRLMDKIREYAEADRRDFVANAQDERNAAIREALLNGEGGDYASLMRNSDIQGLQDDVTAANRANIWMDLETPTESYAKQLEQAASSGYAGTFAGIANALPLGEGGKERSERALKRTQRMSNAAMANTSGVREMSLLLAQQLGQQAAMLPASLVGFAPQGAGKVVSALTKGVGAGTVMGLSSLGQNLYNIEQMGGEGAKKWAVAAANAGIETLGEAIPVGRALDLLGGNKLATKYVYNLLKQAGVEGSTEYLQNVAQNTVTKRAYGDSDESFWQILGNELTSNENLKAAGAGAILGGIMGAGAANTNTMQARFDAAQARLNNLAQTMAAGSETQGTKDVIQKAADNLSQMETDSFNRISAQQQMQQPVQPVQPVQQQEIPDGMDDPTLNYMDDIELYDRLGYYPEDVVDSNMTEQSTMSSTSDTVGDADMPPIQSEEAVPVSDISDIPENPVELLDTISGTRSQNVTMNPTQPIGTGKSKISQSFQNQQIFDKTFTEMISDNDKINYYGKITNQDTLDNAFNYIANVGVDKAKDQVLAKNFKEKGIAPTAEDVAESLILMRYYQSKQDYDTEVRIAEKMAEMSPKAAQALQAFSIMGRMTPEGMLRYTAKSLDDAFEKIQKNKSKAWVEKNRDKFKLTEQEAAEIIQRMETVQNLPDGRDKDKQLALVSKILKDKIPPSAARSLKAYARINMLLNPKSVIRNAGGNLFVVPVNMLGDAFGSQLDKRIAKRTGTRTLGASMKGYGKGLWQGAKYAAEDAKLGIDTRNPAGDKYEFGNGGPSFDNTNPVGKVLNKVERVSNFLLDVGDRPFFNAEYNKSLQNQLRLNNTDVETPEMHEIALQTALQRTWQDNNKFTDTGRKLVDALNFGEEYGIGSMIVPFVKTPANLTKAIIDYSPVGVANAIFNDARKLNRAIEKGEPTAVLQNKFVQDFGKGMAGTIMMLAGLGITKALKDKYGDDFKILGSASEDKDLAAFEKDILGYQPYSVVANGRSYTYDWALPLGGSLATAADMLEAFESFEDAEEGNGEAWNQVASALKSGAGTLANQSYIAGVSDLFGNDDFVTSLVNIPKNAITQFIPLSTLSGQVANFIDNSKRNTYNTEGGPLGYLKNTKDKVVSKIPGAKESLPQSYNTLGEAVKYNDGDSLPMRAINTFLSPFNTSTGAKNKEVANEIYNVYKETGDKTIFPRLADNKITKNGKEINLSTEQKSNLQKLMGETTSKELGSLFKSEAYQSMDATGKANLINEVISYSSDYSKQRLFNAYGKDSDTYKSLVKYKKAQNNGFSTGEYMMYNQTVNDIRDRETTTEARKSAVKKYLADSGLPKKQQSYIYYSIWKK